MVRLLRGVQNSIFEPLIFPKRFNHTWKFLWHVNSNYLMIKEINSKLDNWHFKGSRD